MLPSTPQPLASSARAAPSSAETLLPAFARAAAGPHGSAVPDAIVASAVRGGGAAAPSVRTARTRKAARSSTAGYAASTARTAAGTSKAKASGSLAFLDDPRLSIEDKLMRLLAHLNDKWEKDIEKKMKEAAGGQQGSSASSGSSNSKSGGILGSVASVVKAATQFFPAAGITAAVLQNPASRAILGKIGGPILAAAASALGFPALAPMALKYGPQLVELAAGVVSSLEDAAGASRSVSGSGSSSSGSGGGAAAPSGGSGTSGVQDQLKLMEIQRLFDKQKEMVSLVSNILRSAHDARMIVIQNVR